MISKVVFCLLLLFAVGIDDSEGQMKKKKSDFCNWKRKNKIPVKVYASARFDGKLVFIATIKQQNRESVKRLFTTLYEPSSSGPHNLSQIHFYDATYWRYFEYDLLIREDNVQFMFGLNSVLGTNIFYDRTDSLDWAGRSKNISEQLLYIAYVLIN